MGSPERAIELDAPAGQAAAAPGRPRLLAQGPRRERVLALRLDPAARRARDADGRRAARVALTGTAWFDHEWGPGALPEAAAGWDWFAIQLDDGSELMLYRMRTKDGGATPFSSGTSSCRAAGAPVPLAWDDVRLESDGRLEVSASRAGATRPAGRSPSRASRLETTARRPSWPTRSS